MTIQEVCSEIRTLTKPYYGKMAQATFSRTLTRIESGTSKTYTIKKFFNTFGYFGMYDTWNKMTTSENVWKLIDPHGNEYRGTALVSLSGSSFLITVNA